MITRNRNLVTLFFILSVLIFTLGWGRVVPDYEIIDCGLTVDENIKYDLTGLRKTDTDPEDFIAWLGPYDRPVSFRICSNTLLSCNRMGTSHVKEHSVCLATDRGQYSAGTLDISFEPREHDLEGVVVVSEGDVCPHNKKKTLKSKIELICKPDSFYIEGETPIITCGETDFADEDECELRIQCATPCACANAGPLCNRPPVHWGDWNDWGHTYLAMLFILQAFNLIAQSTGFLSPQVQLKLPATAFLRKICATLPNGTPYVHLNLEKRFVEALFLVIGGSVFSLLTLFCCAVSRDPGAMHLQLGLFLLSTGVWGFVLYYNSYLNEKVFNFVPVLVCMILSVLLVKHAQNNQFLMVMHYVLAVSLLMTGIIEIGVSYSNKLGVLAGMSYFVTAVVMIAGTHGTSHWLLSNHIMEMMVVFCTINIVLFGTLIFLTALYILFQLKGWQRTEPTPSASSDILLQEEASDVKFH